jgi:3-hydroxymyristoyl/3-hydroxydecanoyl-(acyl carrier protein) dehydratase
VLIVEAMAQTGGCLVILGLGKKKGLLTYFMSIDKVKFRKPVVPGDQMVMEVEIVTLKGRFCKLRGTALVDGQKVAEAEFMSMMVDDEKGEAQ